MPHLVFSSRGPTGDDEMGGEWKYDLGEVGVGDEWKKPMEEERSLGNLLNFCCRFTFLLKLYVLDFRHVWVIG